MNKYVIVISYIMNKFVIVISHNEPVGYINIVK